MYLFYAILAGAQLLSEVLVLKAWDQLISPFGAHVFCARHIHIKYL